MMDPVGGESPEGDSKSEVEEVSPLDNLRFTS
jgi:hypothetical protein